ncbi:MAG: DUF4368 domain-containing protein, partial [Tissierellia bacterium]|nr:DUF4368 domain-containing protein [Tissierellia bacterium]
IHEYIEKIVVHEATGRRKERKQEVHVYFNFTGNVKKPKG